MKRIATAAVAATLSLTTVANPAFAAEEKVGSSQYYKECKVGWAQEIEAIEDSYDPEEQMRLLEVHYGADNPTGICIKQMLKEESGYRSNMLGLLIGVPVALVALLGAAAAFSGAIPGVQLPALPF